MEYKGKIYGCAGGRYFPLEATTEDWDRLRVEYRNALFMLYAHGVPKERIGENVCRGIDVLSTRYRKDINAVQGVVGEVSEALLFLLKGAIESNPSPGTRLYDAARNAKAVIAHGVGQTETCTGCKGHGVELRIGTSVICEECQGRGYVIKPEGAGEAQPETSV